jgi:hypothetical protein
MPICTAKRGSRKPSNHGRICVKDVHEAKACGGSRTIVKNQDDCGKQLIDLQNALSSGAMSQSEYDQARSAAIARCNRRD